LAAQLASALNEAVAQLPQAPPIAPEFVRGTNVPGRLKAGKKTVKYFEQDYPSDVVSALGVLMIPANLLEQSLVDLLSALSRLDREKAHALFFSTSNMKARLDMIRAIADLASIPPERIKEVTDALDSVQSVVSRRNDLVHGFWQFEKDRFKVELFGPAKKNKVETIPVSAKTIEQLAADYRKSGRDISMIAQDILIKTTLQHCQEDTSHG
jgi:hypothetical protein